MSAVAAGLRAARALVARAWIQGDYARTADGRRLIVGTGADATCWCTLGALDRVFSGEPKHWRKAADLMSEAIGGDRHIARWNDTKGRTKKQVLAAFDRAIWLAESEQ